MLEAVEAYLLGGAPSLTRVQVAEASGVPLEIAEELWRLLGFPRTADEDVAFTEADVEALRRTRDLVRLGILSPDRQAALVRTWGRSYARLAEWQTTLLTDVALTHDDPVGQLPWLAGEVLPRVEELQSYVWRRHLASAANRMLGVASVSSTTTPLAVCFVDIVGYTSQSQTLDERQLMEWIEYFESVCSGIVVDHGGRIIKNIGDEVLFVVEDPVAAVDAALEMARRGESDDDEFPAVRAGLAYGDVVNHLGDVFGPTVNIAARLTSVARPGSVLVDAGAHEVLSGATAPEVESGTESAGPPGPPSSDPAVSDSAYSFRKLRRISVKGYSRLQSWVVRRD